MARRSGWAVGLVLTLVVGAAGCGGDDEPGEAATPGPAMTQTAPTPTPTPTPEGETYVVADGDTLGSIALQFDTTVDAIVEANDLDDPDTLAIGDELLIPPPDPADEPTEEPTDGATAEPTEDPTER